MPNTHQARFAGHAGYSGSPLPALIPILSSKIVLLMDIFKVSLRSIEVLDLMEARSVEQLGWLTYGMCCRNEFTIPYSTMSTALRTVVSLWPQNRRQWRVRLCAGIRENSGHFNFSRRCILRITLPYWKLQFCWTNLWTFIYQQLRKEDR